MHCRFSLLVAVCIIIATFFGVSASPLPLAGLSGRGGEGSQRRPNVAQRPSNVAQKPSAAWPVKFLYESPDVWVLVINGHDAFRRDDKTEPERVVHYFFDKWIGKGKGQNMDFGFQMLPGQLNRLRVQDILLSADPQRWSGSNRGFVEKAVPLLREHRMFVGSEESVSKSVNKFNEWMALQKDSKQEMMKVIKDVW